MEALSPLAACSRFKLPAVTPETEPSSPFAACSRLKLPPVVPEGALPSFHQESASPFCGKTCRRWQRLPVGPFDDCELGRSISGSRHQERGGDTALAVEDSSLFLSSNSEPEKVRWSQTEGCLSIEKSKLLVESDDGAADKKTAERGITSLVQQFREASADKHALNVRGSEDYCEPTSELLKLPTKDAEGCMKTFPLAHPCLAMCSLQSESSSVSRSAVFDMMSTLRRKRRKAWSVMNTIWKSLYYAFDILQAVLWRPKTVIASIIGLSLIFVALSITAIVFIGNTLGEEFLLPKDRPIRGDPNYLVDFFAGRCLHSKATFGPILERLEAQNRRLGWRLVTFKARDGWPVTALWLPSAVRHAPRVVIAHPGLSNHLDSAVQAMAYFLRSMNISVLAPNLRHHGNADDYGRRVLRWQHQEEDLLGAWDYAVRDPLGVLGGPLDDRLVGLSGFDFGGLAAQIAFAREPRISSLMLDGAVHDIRILVRQFVQERVPWGLTWMFDEQAWVRCKEILSRDLDKDINVKQLLLSREVTGSVAVIHSDQDTFVPPLQRHLLVEDLLKTRSKILMQWYPTFERSDTCLMRPESYMDFPSEYTSFLCTFWSKAFDGPYMSTTSFTRCRDFSAPPGIIS